mmetsp:Transcript_116138/g.339625  ORF Transcript_116138/g.339625 Transcript_116138/m.339625 type:complete len:222 (+) Transcript_116138:2-667(+)
MAALLRAAAPLRAAGRRFAATGPPDPHDVLGVSRGSSREEVRRAYLERAKNVHPDTSRAPDAQRQFQRLQEAYAALSSGSSGGNSSTSSRSPGSPSGDFSSNPMGSGMHYDEWVRARAAQHGAAAGSPWQGRDPPVSAWSLLFSRRGWVRYGLVHRTLYRSWVAALSAWPAWFFLAGLVMLFRGRPVVRPVDGVYYDGYGRAWCRDRQGIAWRMPGYDVIR